MNFCLRALKRVPRQAYDTKIISVTKNYRFVKYFSTKDDFTNGSKNSIFKHTPIYQFKDFEKKYEKFGDIDIENLINFIKTLQNSNSLNETIFLIFKVSEFQKNQGTTLDPCFVPKVANVIERIKSELQSNLHEDLMIGTLALSLSRFDFLQDEQIWLVLGDCIHEGRFFSNFRECLHALEGLRVLPKISTPEYYDEIFSILEEVCFFSEDLKEPSNLIRFSDAISLNSTRSRVIFEKIAKLISENPLEKIPPSDLLTISQKVFLLSVGTSGFSLKIQAPMERELLRFSKIDTHEAKCFLVSLIKLYSMMDPKILDKQRDFVKKIEENLLAKNYPFNFNDIVQILGNLPRFSFDLEDRIYSSFIDKLMVIKHEIQLLDIISFYDILVERFYESGHTEIPKEKIDHFDEYVEKNMELQDSEVLFHYIHELNTRSIVHLNKKTMNILIFQIIRRLRDHTPEQLLEYYAIYDSLAGIIDLGQIKKELTELQEFIRIVSEVPGFG